MSAETLTRVHPAIEFFCIKLWKKASKIMAKCVFGLHRCGRIACAPFSKRGRKSGPKKLYLGPFWTHAGKMAELPRCVPRVLKGCPGRPKSRPGSAQASPKGAQGVPQGCPSEPKGCPKGVQGAAKDAQGTQRVPKGAQMVPKVCPGEPKGLH